MSQQRLGLIGEVSQQIVNTRNVARRLGKCSRELLNIGVSIQLERIEVLILFGILLVAMQNLGFRLRLEIAQLLSQSYDRLTQFPEAKVKRMRLLIQARLEDADLTGPVQQ